MMSRLFESLFGSKEVRILILGLDNAGKTTILYRLQNESDEAVQTIPTIGFNVETLQYKNIKVRFWCMVNGAGWVQLVWDCDPLFVRRVLVISIDSLLRKHTDPHSFFFPSIFVLCSPNNNNNNKSVHISFKYGI
jgi:hypothetical protein